MNNPESLSSSHSNPLSDQWLAAFSESSTNSASEPDTSSNQDAEYEQLMADIERQDAEYEAVLTKLREQEEVDELKDVRFDFANIDFEFDNIGVSPLMNLIYMIELVGVYADIKPLALNHILLDPDAFIEDREYRTSAFQNIQKSLQSLGITFTYAEYESEEDYPPVVSWWASKDPQLITEFQTLQEQYHAASPAERDEITRREGQLLGYPSTATEYFIVHSHAREDNPDLPLTDGGVGPKFALTEYIHSPEHAEAEYASYEKPLYDAFRHYLPEASELLNQQLSPDE